MIQSKYWYHVAPVVKAGRIQRQGLKLNQQPHFTNKSFLQHINDLPIYQGYWPIFLMNKQALRKKYWKPGADLALFQVDIQGLRLVVDVPSLMDSDVQAFLAEDHLWFEETPKQLRPFTDEDGALYYEDIYDSRVIMACSKLTGTVACAQDIPVDKIQRIK